MKEEMEYLGFDVGYGWWKPAASKMQPLQDMQIRDDPKKGLHDVRSFVGVKPLCASCVLCTCSVRASVCPACELHAFGGNNNGDMLGRIPNKGLAMPRERYCAIIPGP